MACRADAVERTRTHRPWTGGVDYPTRRGAPRAKLHRNSALNWDRNGVKRPQMLLTPKEEMAGELRHASGA